MNVGIDLGTSYSLIARMHPDGATALIRDAREEDRFHTPSVVQISGGSAFVGSLAEDMAELHPDVPVIRFFKRRLGEREPISYDDQGRPWHAESVAALLLAKLRFDAEAEAAQPVAGAVITVPAHFGDRQRKAVAAAAMLARLPLLELLDEPVAATLHYGVTAGAQGKVLLAYDFGGGTFDATTLSLDADGIYVLAKAGLTDLGGKELDERIGEMILARFRQALGRPPELTGRTLLELRRCSEAIKIELCAPGTRRVRQTVLLGSDAVEVEIERAEFERSIEEHVERTMVVVEECLRDSGLEKKDVDTLLLIGGSSLVPVVATRLRRLFSGGNQQLLHHEPTKAVAFGAAMRAAQIAGEAAQYRLPTELRGVTGYNVGIRTVDARSGKISIEPLIKKNMPLPISVRKTYYTTQPDQRIMVLDLVQYRQESDLLPLGRLTVGPLASPYVNYPIQVTVEYREDGTVHLLASDATTGAELEQTFGSESAEEIGYLARQRKLLESVLVSRT